MATEAFLLSIVFTPAGALLKRDTLNQQSNIKGDLRGYNVRAVYTEPVWKKSLLEFSVSKSNTSSTSEK